MNQAKRRLLSHLGSATRCSCGQHDRSLHGHHQEPCVTSVGPRKRRVILMAPCIGGIFGRVVAAPRVSCRRCVCCWALRTNDLGADGDSCRTIAPQCMPGSSFRSQPRPRRENPLSLRCSVWKLLLLRLLSNCKTRVLYAMRQVLSAHAKSLSLLVSGAHKNCSACMYARLFSIFLFLGVRLRDIAQDQDAKCYTGYET